jgi:hypothetical protein
MQRRIGFIHITVFYVQRMLADLHPSGWTLLYISLATAAATAL